MPWSAVLVRKPLLSWFRDHIYPAECLLEKIKESKRSVKSEAQRQIGKSIWKNTVGFFSLRGVIIFFNKWDSEHSVKK
jgi:hypothetical protein